MHELFCNMIQQTKLGASITGSSFIAGLFLKVTPELMNEINDVLQMIAFLVTIMVGVLTMVGMKKKRDKNKPDVE